MKNFCLVSFASLLLLIIFSGCGSDETNIYYSADLPLVTTVNAESITYTSASINAEITDSGGEYIVARGVCLSESPEPGLEDAVYLGGTGDGEFSVLADGLNPETTYYVRAFAANVGGTSFGEDISFSTKNLTTPAISTAAISNITPATAISGGDILDDGGLPIIGRGVCVSEVVNPTLDDTCFGEGVGSGSFIALMTGLSQNTTYHVRAYASNDLGTSYGNDLTFTTGMLELATVLTVSPSSVSYTTATAGGNVTQDNGSQLSARGLCWSTFQSPDIEDTCYSEPGGLGSFSTNITGLVSNTTYYIRAFAVNEVGTSYGNEVTLTTLSMVAPELTTKAITGISSNIAGSGGLISTDGGSAITAKGVCWSVNPSPATANFTTTDGTGPDSYNSTLNGLTPLTTYYVRAYATNAVGTTYGNELSFTTTDLVYPGPTVPVVGTVSSSISGSSTASSGGYVSSDGGSTVTARGICWSTTPEPTLADSCYVDGSGVGFFSSTATGLSGCGIVYYIRAYATNSTGTGYGSQTSLSTGLLPTVTTSDITDIGYYTATSGGLIEDDGGCQITQKGVTWNYFTQPSTGNTHSEDGSGTAAFTSNMEGLYANRTYYARAYATNSVGTAYGPEKVFTTLTPPTPYIGQNYAGGVVFYLEETGEHGMVVTPQSPGAGTWGCEGTDIPTNTIVGSGATNTASIVASCSSDGTAAKLCDSLSLNGYSDWFLPSNDEMSLIYNKLSSKALQPAPGQYWTSSQRDASFAWYIYTTGQINYTYKRVSYPYLAVRSF
ncbi:MAG: hypothetical protein C0608_01055 [Deltaproteobacteria bacterium]|nr:MAG: hypothetical protein C0608_01055 [Deltaproteobacteria bacterium]